MKRLPAVLLVLFLLRPVPGLCGDEADLGRDAKKLHDSCLRMARSSRIRDQQVRLLEKALENVSTEELGKVIDLLRAETKPLKSLPEVIGKLQTEWLTRQFGTEPLERGMVDLADLLKSDDPGTVRGLIAGSQLLEDSRLAIHVALKCARSEERTVRVRAALGLRNLVNFGEGGEEVAKALVALLDDEDPGVRAVACRSAFQAELPPVYPWAVEHLDDGKKSKIAVSEEEEALVPGEEALRGLQALTRIQEDLEYRELRKFSPQQKASLEELYRAWWKQHGEAFPPPGFREADFNRKPSETKSLIVETGRTIGTFQFWSRLDRTRVRLTLDELEWSASTILDYDASFHLRYMAQGMRSDDGEAYQRHFPVGLKYVLARKRIGCYVLVFQVLAGDRLKIHLRFHDPVR